MRGRSRWSCSRSWCPPGPTFVVRVGDHGAVDDVGDLSNQRADCSFVCFPSARLRSQYTRTGQLRHVAQVWATGRSKLAVEHESKLKCGMSCCPGIGSRGTSLDNCLVSMYSRHKSPLDESLLAAAREAALRRAEAEALQTTAKANEQLAIRRLQLAGGSVREIAKALGYSHQRIQQMIDAVDDGRGWKRKGKSPDILICSFCRKTQKAVEKLIAGPNVYICTSVLNWHGLVSSADHLQLLRQGSDSEAKGPWTRQGFGLLRMPRPVRRDHRRGRREQRARRVTAEGR